MRHWQDWQKCSSTTPREKGVRCLRLVFICTWCLYLKGGRVGDLVLSLFLVTQVSWNNKREPPFPSTERWMSNRSHGFRRISIPAVCSWVTHSPVGQRGIPCWNRFGVPMACCRSRCIFAENASHMLPTGFGQISAWDGVSRVKFWSERLRCRTKGWDARVNNSAGQRFANNGALTITRTCC